MKKRPIMAFFQRKRRRLLLSKGNFVSSVVSKCWLDSDKSPAWPVTVGRVDLPLPKNKKRQEIFLPFLLNNYQPLGYLTYTGTES